MRAVEEVRENKRFTITSLSLHFLKSNVHFFTKLCLINLSFRNCVQNWCWRCLRKNTNWNCRPVGWTFRHNTVRNTKTSWVMWSQGMRHGYHMEPVNWSSSLWSRGMHHRQERRNSSRPFQLGRSCAQCFGTEKAFYLWISCLKAPQSMQVSIATHLKNCAARYGISDLACLAVVLWWFMTAPAHTHYFRKISSRHFAGNNLIIPYSPDITLSDFHLFLRLKSFLACWLFHDDREVKILTMCLA